MKKKKIKMKVKKNRKMKVLSQEQINLHKEIEYIIKRAEECDSRVVSFGSLILFSTQTSDAWLLDPQDELALCLLKDGARQPFSILETPTNFSIEWQAKYEIIDHSMIFYWNDGRIKEIIGYPVKQIIESITNCSTLSSTAAAVSNR
jgi:hypothetical protein